MSGASSSRNAAAQQQQQYDYGALRGDDPSGSRTAASSAGSCCKAFRSSLVLLGVALLLGGIAFLLWPTAPEVEVKDISLDGIDISQDDDDSSSSIIPSFTLDVTLELVVQITNKNLYGLTYDHIRVHVLYRGDEIAQVQADGGSVPSQSVTNATATVDLQGKQILDNFGDLWSDISNRSVPFVTVTQLTGNLDLFFLHPHIQVCASSLLLLMQPVAVAGRVCCIYRWSSHS